jgi:phage shock protein PspC (stress-responsive transcriptional regulator)
MAGRLRSFLAFLYDFVVGDDWRIAVGVVAGLALTYAVSRTSVPAWWLVPVLLVLLLPASLWLAVKRK